MAADKTHLKTKLIPTDQKTDAGRIIYRNAKTGELHSELSITFQYPEGTGMWINVPSVHNGRVYSPKQVMRMLKNGDIQPTSSHASEAEAIEKAIFRSNNLEHIPATTEDYIGADIDQSKVISIDAEVPVADTKIQSKGGVDIKNKAKRVAAASQSRNLTEILDQVDAEHADDYYKYYPNSPRNTDPNWSGTPQPERILNKATQYLDPDNQARLDAAEATRIAERESIIGQAMSAYGPRTGPEVPKPGSRAGSSANLSMGVNQDKHHVSRDRYADMTVNEAENKFQNQDTGFPKTWGERFKDAMSKVAGVAEMSYPGPSQEEIEAKRQNDLIEERANASDKAAAIAQYDQGQAELLAQSKTLSEKNRNFVAAKEMAAKYNAQKNFGDEDANFDANGGYKMGVTDDGIFNYKGLKLNPNNQPIAEDEQVYGGGNYKLQPDDDGIFPGLPKYNSGPPRRSSMGGVLGSYAEGPSTRQSNKPKSKFEYKPHMTPEQKANATLENVKLAEYGEMPGFKKAKNGNYWSADDTSPFWQTDAGYEKAMQTWGEKPGWVKPGYRPKKQELDINAIKKWFTPNK